MFDLFPKLPPELRNRTWAYAANQEPRTLDIWTAFKRCEVGNSVFYTQCYSTELTKPALPAILQACREARTEGQKHYTYEFRTHMRLGNGVTVTIEPKIYINYACDTLVPRGFWNIVSFADFLDKCEEGRLVHLAVDTEGSFWRENMRDYCTKGCWAPNGVQEVLLYDSRGDKVWKGSDYLEKFRKRYKGGPMELVFEELEEESQSLKDVQKYLDRTFDRIKGKEEKVVEGEEAPAENTSNLRYLDDCAKTEPGELRKPKITLTKLVAKPIGA